MNSQNINKRSKSTTATPASRHNDDNMVKYSLDQPGRTENTSKKSSSVAHFIETPQKPPPISRKSLKIPPPTLPKPTTRRRHVSEDNKYNGVGITNTMIHVDVEEMERLAKNDVRRKLEGEIFEEKKVTSWCKEISNGLRDKLRILTSNRRKVTVTTYIGSKVTMDSGADVHVKCQRYVGDVTSHDVFVTVAVEGEDMFAWVSMFVCDYAPICYK